MIDALPLPHMAHGTGTCVPPSARPSATAPVLGQLLAGQPVTIWAQDTGWLRVQYIYIKIDGELIA